MLSSISKVAAFQTRFLIRSSSSPFARHLINPLRNNDMMKYPMATFSRQSFSTNVNSRDTLNTKEAEVTQTSIKDKIKSLWKNYGTVAVGSYLGLYIMTLGSIFLSLDYDIFRASTFGFSPEHAVLKVCEIFESVTGSNALPGYIREHPKGIHIN